MKAKDYLKRLKRLDTIIKQKQQEITDLRLTASNTGSFDYSKERVQASPSGDAPFVRPVLKIIELEQQINAEIDRFVAEKHRIINEIQGLQDSRYVEILFRHYVEFKSFETISVELNYTYQYVRELHGYALQDFQKTYNTLLKTYIPI